ncbi:hypothetical protein [Cellulosilyticum lentocellum]|uniref:Uncharacterized protein n=1 Tax=Cellulosilyticum lentocellum (strain ATCC 49066 / DSM 5427 / NCIMB 11756 / RHM5) TaxID=642492 RepID=F2JH56_CELLD|nr:hypothetical protein [Cellulosilyticum lentocellum]ADZ81871.1 hypothetical protein Clole_0112 [Cellulosilyticum lentocellum DSM 5427]
MGVYNLWKLGVFLKDKGYIGGHIAKELEKNNIMLRMIKRNNSKKILI